MKATAWLVLVLELLAPWLALAQSTAELHVTVKDPNGALLNNATVTVSNPARNFVRSTSLSLEGKYQFLSLPPGTYQVTVEAPGFAKSVAQGVTVTVGQRAELPIALQLAAVSEVVNITADAALVETQRSAASTTIDQVRIDNLPINGRNYINFALTDSKIARDTAPSIGAAPTSGLNFSGQRARSNLVNVDGADAVDNSVNGIRSTISQEAVQEFQIVTNSYTAEYGRASGGVVNIISRAGTNQLHGTAFGYLRNRHIQAVNPFSTVKDPAYTRVQAGFTLGGPIRKNRTFYFLSYETTRRRESGFSSIGSNNFGLVPFTTSSGPVLLTSQQVAFIQANATNPAIAPLLPSYISLAGAASGIAINGSIPGLGAAFPPLAVGAIPVKLPASFVPLKSLIGNFPVTEGTSIVSLRLDQKITNNQNLALRAGVSPSTVTGIQVNAQGPQNFGQNAWSRTSDQQFRDFTITGQHTWTLGSNKVNEFRFQAARRGLSYSFSREAPGASNPAVNIAGFAFFGREPFSIVDRVERRFQFTDNFSVSKGTHIFKFGGDVNYLPLEADFTVNFGGVYNFGRVTLPAPFRGFPDMSPIQAYGLGLPQVLIQGVGNPHDEFSNKVFSGYVQDTWRIRSNLTLNYGVRYDVELTPEFKAINALSQAAQDALGITQGIPRDYNNVAPRIGLAWDPRNDGRTVLRASYGLFYDHPLLALAFDSDVADAAQAPQIVLFGGAPGGCSLNAANTFQGFPGCPPATLAPFNYVASEQRFNATPDAPSIFVGQQYLNAGVPLILQPFGFPTAKNFVYAYANQANLTFEHDLGHNFALSLEYNFNGGRHLNRPINANATRPEQLTTNFSRAVAAVNGLAQTLAGLGVPAASIQTLTSKLMPSDPLSVGICPTLVRGALVQAGLPPTLPVTPAGNYVPAALVSFFRPSGLNPSLLSPASPVALCGADANAIMSEFKFGQAVGLPTIPFSDMPANYSNGSSVYHGLSANLRKRMGQHYEFLASYTWSHTIDDSTDLESPLSPQDNYRPDLERSNSLFDQRHRFVFSGVYNSGRLGGDGVGSKLFSDWTLAPVIEVGSGRPFNIITSTDRNFDLGVGTDRPRVVEGNAPPTACGDPVVASSFSPTGFFQLPCFLNGTFTGNLGRNAGVRPTTVFTDLRVARRLRMTERLNLDAIMDVFNLINRFNVADVNPLYTQAGIPTAAFDPRQFQFALKLSW